MADAALAVTQEGGLFYLPEDTTMQHKDSTVQKRTFFKKFLDYFNDANKDKNHKKFDFSIIGGPHYSTDTKLGLGLVAAGLYRTDRNDMLLPPSNVSLFGDVSTVGFYMLGIRGTHIFPQDKYRLDYTLYFYSFPSKFWGIGYDMGKVDANESDLDRWQAQVKASFLFRIADNLYIGPMVSYDYVHGKNMERPELLEGMNLTTANYGVGLSLAYDSRDVLTNPHKGYYLNITQCFRPKFLGNDYAFSTTDLRTSYYHPVWKGGLLAGELRGTFNFGNPSWAMMALLGSQSRDQRLIRLCTWFGTEQQEFPGRCQFLCPSECKHPLVPFRRTQQQSTCSQSQTGTNPPSTAKPERTNVTGTDPSRQQSGRSKAGKRTCRPFPATGGREQACQQKPVRSRSGNTLRPFGSPSVMATGLRNES